MLTHLLPYRKASFKRAIKPPQVDTILLLFKFENYYIYKASRQRPHYYEPYEKAEAVIAAIKNSKYYSKLKEGMDEVQMTLKLWRTTSGHSADFPEELELDSIASSIMQYYIKRDLQPLPPVRGHSRERRRDWSPQNADF